MPYEVVKRDGKWCVVKKGGSKTFGCHSSKSKAQAQLRALYASEDRAMTKMHHQARSRGQTRKT